MNITPNNRPLFVTMLFDLGSSSQSSALKKLLSSEFDFYEFDLKKIRLEPSFVKRCFLFFKSLVLLRKAVKSASRRNVKIVFFNLKPAFFTYDLWDSTNGLTCSDFSHSLFDWYNKREIKHNLRYYFQSKIYKRFYKVLTWTENLKHCTNEVYGVALDKVIKVPLPMDFEELGQEPQKTNPIPRVLFVGGEFYRKGGNHLIEAWSRLKGKCELIILTNTVIEAQDGITVFKGVVKGSPEHINLFKSSDIFILPTLRDAFPYVLGEAAISSLAIITTQFALGAKDIIDHGKSGYIANSPAECADYLVQLIETPDLIDKFKTKTYELMQQNYSKEAVIQAYVNAVK